MVIVIHLLENHKLKNHMLGCLHYRMLNQKRWPQAKFNDVIQKISAEVHQLQMVNKESEIGIGMREKPLRQQMDPKKKSQLLQSVSSSGRGDTQEVALGCKEDEIVFRQHVFPQCLWQIMANRHFALLL